MKDVLKKDGWIIVEHFHRTELQESYGRLKSFKDRRLGDSCLTFFPENLYLKNSVYRVISRLDIRKR